MKFCVFTIITLMIVVAATSFYFYHNTGCWCGKFLTRVPDDGFSHYGDAAQLNQLVEFQCRARQCMEQNTIPFNEQKRTWFNYSIYRLILLGFVGCELLTFLIFWWNLGVKN